LLVQLLWVKNTIRGHGCGSPRRRLIPQWLNNRTIY
jgi:hypothetical protein